MISIKERTMWFIGRDRLLDKEKDGYVSFMYNVSGDVILSKRPLMESMWFDWKPEMKIGVRYTWGGMRYNF